MVTLDPDRTVVELLALKISKTVIPKQKNNMNVAGYL